MPFRVTNPVIVLSVTSTDRLVDQSLAHKQQVNRAQSYAFTFSMKKKPKFEGMRETANVLHMTALNSI